MACRVLVTRPQPGADATAGRLAAQGRVPVVVPLTRIVALDPPSLPGADFDAVAVTSANALRLAPPSLLAAAADTRCFAVGRETAAAAAAAGFRAVTTGPGDATALAETIAGALPRPARVLYLCGHVRMPDFERALRTAGFVVEAVETYDTRPAGVRAADLAAAAGDPAPQAVLLHSAGSARLLSALLAEPVAGAPLSRALFCALSARVAAALESVPAARIRTAARPDEAALLALLDEACDPSP